MLAAVVLNVRAASQATAPRGIQHACTGWSGWADLKVQLLGLVEDS